MTRLAAEVVESSQEPRRSRGRRGPGARRRSPCTAIVVGAFFVTSMLWINPAGFRQTGDPEDVDQATWFVRYAATAVSHFRLPALETMTMNAPHSVNLMWNTSLLLPGVVVSPVTLLFGPQVALTTLLAVGFAGSAAAMYYVLRRWHASPLAAALGGALYGFSPALVNSGIGHYSLVLAMLPPLIIDRVLRLVTGQGSPVRNGLWLGAAHRRAVVHQRGVARRHRDRHGDPAGGPGAQQAARSTGARPPGTGWSGHGGRRGPRAVRQGPLGPVPRSVG